MPDRIKPYKLICRGGLNSNENHLDLAENSPGAATRLVNYEPGLYGGYRRIEGYEYYDTDYAEVGSGVSEGHILGVVMYRNSGFPYVIAARKDSGVNTYSFWKHTPGVGWSKLVGAPSRAYTDGTYTASKLRHAQFDFGAGDIVVFVDGVNPAVVFDNTTWTEITVAGAGDQAIEAPTVVENFENHLFLSCDPTFKSVVAHSAPSDPTDWTAASGAGQLTVGFPIVQIKPFRDDLFVFGSNSIKKIGVDASAAFVLEQVTSNVGCIARDSVLEIGGDLIFLAPDGIRPVAGTSRIGDVELETISRDIRGRIVDMIKNNDLDLLNGVVIRAKSQFRYFVGDDTVPAVNSNGIIGGLTAGDGSVTWEFGNLRGIRASCASSEYIGTQEYILHGDYDGMVYRQEIGNTLNGADMISIYSTPYLDFGDTEMKKVMHKANLFVRSEGEFEMRLSLDYDWGDPNTARPVSYSSESSGRTISWGDGSSTYGSDAVSYGTPNKPVLTVDLQGSGYSTRVNLVTVGDFAPHSIQGIVLEFGMSGR